MLPQPDQKAPGRAGNLPQFWSQATDTAGHMVLTYAVRGGKAGALLVAMGTTCVLADAWGIHWMLSGGEVTTAGLVFVALVPAVS